MAGVFLGAGREMRTVPSITLAMGMVKKKAEGGGRKGEGIRKSEPRGLSPRMGGAAARPPPRHGELEGNEATGSRARQTEPCAHTGCLVQKNGRMSL